MTKKIINFCLLFILIFFNFSCSQNQSTPMCVTFKNATMTGSQNNVITAIYLEDKRIRDYYTDIFIKSDDEFVKLELGKELNIPFTITIEEKNIWFSLTNLINQENNTHIDLTTFAKAEPTTYVFKCDKKTNLTFKAVAGDYQYNMKNGKVELINYFDVSKPFSITTIQSNIK